MPVQLKFIFVFLIGSFLFTLSACGPTSKTVDENYDILTPTSGLKLDKSQEPTQVYKRPGAPTLAAYNRFIIDPILVNYIDQDMKELEPEQIEEMQRYFHGAMVKELTEAGYEVGTRSDAKTMRISFTVSGLKAWAGGGAVNVAAMAAGAATGLPVVFAINVGEVTVEGVFRESLSNRIDAVVVDRAGGSYLLNAKPWSTWADVEGAFDKWTEGIREAIDTAHGR